MKIILQILLLFSSVKSFCLGPRFRDYGLCLTTPLISSRTPFLIWTIHSIKVLMM